MTGNIREYAKIGLVHHLLHLPCTEDPAYHAETLKKFVTREDIECFDFCVPYAEPYRQQAIDAVSAVNKDKSYSLHLFPARKISLATADGVELAMTKFILADQIRQAAKCGATGFVFVSGADMPNDREAAKERFTEFCRWFCAECKPFGITALLEPFDRTIDKKFLYGSIEECCQLIDRVSEEFDNIGIEFDIAHLPLMFEETCDAIRRCGNRIKRIHLGNCVLKDTESPLYGDMHPAMGIPGGEVNLPELTEILRTFLEIGYLDKNDRKPLICEMRPLDGEASIERTIEHTFRLLEEAWAAV